MTLLSTISNESINENLKKRFGGGEIYVSASFWEGFALRGEGSGKREARRES